MIASDAARYPMFADGAVENAEDCLRAVIVAGLDPGYKACFPIDETVLDDFIFDESCE